MIKTQPASLEIRRLDVNVAQREILHDVNLNVLPGEMCVILGGNGAGKTALLRALAGLEQTVAGEMWIDDREITQTAPNKRGVAMMCQTFPLWPHMCVFENVAFGLRQHHLSRSQIHEHVERELQAVGLSEFLYHLPSQLWPSQRQRVALARTLIAKADVVLLDEPLSEQDPKLRSQLLRLLKKQQQQSGATMLLATQEREEAMRIADRIAIIHDGRIQQVGTPIDLYDAPRNRFVAEYLGGTNLLDGEIEYAGDQPLFRAANGMVIPLFDEAYKRPRKGSAMFRPNDLHIVSAEQQRPGEQIRFTGRVDQAEFLGDSMRYCIDLAGDLVWMDLPRTAGQPQLHIGDQLVVGLDASKIRILEH